MGKWATMSKQINDFKTDPVITRLLERMPDKVADSYSEEQLAYLRNAIGAREWGRHKVDLRGTIKFIKWRYYYVVLAGRNRRTLSEKERRIAVLDGLLNIDNNRAERAIKPFVIGRKIGCSAKLPQAQTPVRFSTVLSKPQKPTIPMCSSM